MVNYYTYIEIFLENIEKTVSLSEMEKYFKIPHQTIKAHVQELIDSNILVPDKRERFLFYKLNLENPLTYEYITICEKERLIKFLRNELFNELYLTMYPHFKDTKMLIFGSSAKEKKYSDIDILLITKNTKVREVLKKFELTYSVKIHPIITEKIDKTLLIEIRKKHIIFNGHEYFVGILYKAKF